MQYAVMDTIPAKVDGPALPESISQGFGETVLGAAEESVLCLFEPRKGRVHRTLKQAIRTVQTHAHAEGNALSIHEFTRRMIFKTTLFV